MGGGTRDELITLAREWDEAMVANDAEAIGQFMSDDWTIVGSDGQVGDKVTFLELVRSGALSHDVMETHDLSVRVYGDTAVTLARGISGGKYQGQPFREVGAGLLRFRAAGRALELRFDSPVPARWMASDRVVKHADLDVRPGETQVLSYGGQRGDGSEAVASAAAAGGAAAAVGSHRRGLCRHRGRDRAPAGAGEGSRGGAGAGRRVALLLRRFDRLGP